MKILFITNHKSIANANGGYISDYLNDLVFYGLYELFGNQVVDSTPIISLYNENKASIDQKTLWGGFSTFWLIENDLGDRSHIEEKIQDRYYDLIIYGAIKRCTDYYSIVSASYPSHRVIIIDGSDEQTVLNQYLIHPYFKRELNQINTKILPISFSIPTCKLAQNPGNIPKNKIFGNVFPGLDQTYTFSEEQNYYYDYEQSYYGLTMKKDGWDCMRHYEIISNYCMPYFIDLDNCPKKTMINFPKKQIKNAMILFNQPSFSENLYYELLNEVFEYTKSNLTTKHIAIKLLETIF